MKNYSIEEKNIIEEKRKFLLSLRKNKINFKLFEGRNISAINNNNKKLNIFDEKRNITIIQIKSKFNEMVSKTNIQEEKLLNSLNELLDIFSSFIESNKNININEEIIESSVLEKLYRIIMLNGFINNEEIITNILIIFSTEIFIYNHFVTFKIYKNKYVADDRYINLISSLLNVNIDNIVYNTYKFIGLLSKDSQDIFNKLYEYKIFEKIINHHEFNDNIEMVRIKLFCICGFKLKSIYKNDLKLSLEIQVFYNFIFNKYILNKTVDDEFMIYFVKLIKNLSWCINDDYLKNLLESGIIQFLLDYDKRNNSITKKLLKIIGNMSSTLNEEIYSGLYKEVIQFLIDNILNNKHNDSTNSLILWNINNFLVNYNFCFDIFFQYDLITIFKNYLLGNKNIDENIFNEICLGFRNLIFSINHFKKYYLCKKYNIISLIINGFRKIDKINYLNKTGKNILEILFLLFIIKDKEISEFNKFTFEASGGNEYIFDTLKTLLLEQDINEQNIFKPDKNNNTGNELLQYINVIETKILYNK